MINYVPLEEILRNISRWCPHGAERVNSILTMREFRFRHTILGRLSNPDTYSVKLVSLVKTEDRSAGRWRSMNERCLSSVKQEGNDRVVRLLESCPFLCRWARFHCARYLILSAGCRRSRVKFHRTPFARFLVPSSSLRIVCTPPPFHF